MNQTETKSRLGQMLDTACQDFARYLRDPQVNELMLNPDGCLWADFFGEGRVNTGLRLTPTQGHQIIRIISGLAGKTVSNEAPCLSTEIPISGERFLGLLPPVVANPSFTIRKRSEVIFSLEDYVQSKSMTQKQLETLRKAVSEKNNLLIVGGTSSGKTTFANALLAEMATLEQRIFLLEDTKELQCLAKDVVSVQTSPACSMRDLIQISLRMRPDRIVVGEVRGAEALELLKAWNTGHPGGLATIHANSALEALYRLEDLVMEAVSNSSTRLIAQAIDKIIFLKRHSAHPRVEEILSLQNLSVEETAYQIKSVI